MEESSTTATAHKVVLSPPVIGLLLFLIAFGLRLGGIGWGLPNESHHWSRHPDEPVVYAYSQQIEPTQGKFTPGFYNYGTLYLTTLRVATDMVNAYGGGPKENDTKTAYEAIGRYHLAGRLISALAGAGIAWIVFAMLMARTNRFGASVGGLAVAFAPGLVVHSRFQTVDVLATFLLALGLHYALKLSPPEQTPSNPAKLATLSGLFIGLSAGTKYTGLLGLLALVTVCGLNRQFKALAIGTAACLVAFMVSTPGAFLEPDKFWNDFRYEMAHTSTGHGLVFAGTSPGFIYHLVNLAIGFGFLLCVLGVAGLARACHRKHPWAIALAVFAAASYLLIGRAEVKFLRYTFPLIPVLAVGVGWLAGRAHEHPNPRMRLVGFAALLGLGGFLGGGLATSLQATMAMRSDSLDPRRQILGLFPKDEKTGPIGLVSDPWFYTPDFYPEAGAPRFVPFKQREAERRRATFAPVLRYVPDNSDERTDWDTRLFDQKPVYVVYSSFETEGLSRLAESPSPPPAYRDQVARYQQFLERLRKEYDLVYQDPNNPWAVVHDLMYIRPSLWVWKLKTSSQTPSTGSSTTSSTNEERAPIR